MERKIDFLVNAVKWFDKINGNTYHSVRITRTSDGAILKSFPIVYGYGDHYRQTALDLMAANNWIDAKYKNHAFQYERENNYPIQWEVRNGLKKEMKQNVL